MKMIQHTELPTEHRIFTTRNPERSIMPAADLLICLNETPAEGKWCLLIDEDGNVWTDMFFRGLLQIAKAYRILHFCQI